MTLVFWLREREANFIYFSPPGADRVASEKLAEINVAGKRHDPAASV
jgi:hypothetical protein